MSPEKMRKIHALILHSSVKRKCGYICYTALVKRRLIYLTLLVCSTME